MAGSPNIYVEHDAFRGGPVCEPESTMKPLPRFPSELTALFIIELTRPGDIVFDPMMGS